VGGAGRRFLADKTVIAGGKVKTQQNWSAECYDFATAADAAQTRQAYLAYVDYMVKKFQPRWVNVAIEMNLFGAACPAAWPGLVDVERAAYDAAKAAKADVIAFPSIQIDLLYGYSACPPPMQRDDCYDANFAMLEHVKRDRFAISTYPYLIGAIQTPSGLPANWF